MNFRTPSSKLAVALRCPIGKPIHHDRAYCQAKHYSDQRPITEYRNGQDGATEDAENEHRVILQEIKCASAHRFSPSESEQRYQRRRPRLRPTWKPLRLPMRLPDLYNQTPTPTRIPRMTSSPISPPFCGDLVNRIETQMPKDLARALALSDDFIRHGDLVGRTCCRDRRCARRRSRRALPSY